ncbi:valyl-tRNA synthetase [Pyricularia oryzae]|nr:valyl-tRNA synthetase [Pyricularia oryzae]KAI7914750.1 valyl-tRNA synthetase [Pyricularia oryzae]
MGCGGAVWLWKHSIFKLCTQIVTTSRLLSRALLVRPSPFIFRVATMATNSGRGNPIGSTKGPDDGTPPPLSQDTKSAIQETTSTGNPGTHAAGQDAGAAEAPAKVKTAKELEKERKKAEKQAKFEQKKAAAASKAAPAAGADKPKKEKAKKAEEPALPPYENDTPPGEKKRLRPLTDPHYTAYNPVAVESAWYDWWEKEGFFKPEFTKDGKVKDEGSFVIVHPPPNVTGALHMGHALGDSLQDLMIRYERMRGKTTLWVPGCDHAGIATQTVVEKMLWKSEQKTRHDLGRPDFISKVWEWKGEYHEKINNALRKMGGSFDWSREAFTMDENSTAAVMEAFVRLHKEGIIYRANRLVNWCTQLNTAISNLEVENKEIAGRTLLDVPGYAKKVEFGVIVYFKYPLEGSDETITVATTRIETMLGDTGIAVHPDDERYKHVIGKNAVHPFIPGRKLPIVADKSVEMDFGTGAVKLTPAHDPNDFAMGQTHKLEFINILTDDGLMNENAGAYKGQKRFDVRYTIQDDLKKAGLYVDKKDNPMSLPMCERSKDIIEPIMKPQWWMRMREMADAAIGAVEDGSIKIRPQSSEKSFKHWMRNIQDWCISRQLWWGHQCPVYYAEIEGDENDRGANNRWFAGKTEQEAEEKAKKALGEKKFKLVRDDDVLDTWFSSGLWPFSTLGWPNTSAEDLQKLYPTSTLETGWDILTFWIARMIMLGMKLTGKVPFNEVYCHSLVRDSDGRKMSKSLGNVIDPLDVIKGINLDDLHAKLLVGNLASTEVEKATKYQKQAFPQGIPECGADALRFCMINYTTSGGDINFDIKVMHAFRRFSNKIWQASKYVLGKLENYPDFVPREKRTLGGSESLAEQWILHKMNQATKGINEALQEREFMKSSQLVYAYWYNQLCDVFIENSKALLQDGSPAEQESAMQTLYTALESALVLIHPFMPFVTEELWQRLPRRKGDTTPSLVVASYPQYDEALDNASAEIAYELVLDCSKGIRSLMAEYALKDEAQVFIQCYDDASVATARKELQSIKSLSGKGVTAVQVLEASAKRPAGCVVFPCGSTAAVFLHVKGRVDIDAEIAKAQKKLDRASGQIDRQKKVLNDPKYQEKVTAELQATEKKRLADMESEAEGFKATIKQFEDLKLE